MTLIDPNAEAYYIGLMNAAGYRDKDLKKPIIGIVNSWNDVNPGHKPLKELAQYVKEGVWAAGGAPAEFTVPAPCDGMAQLRGMQYVLASRDLIAGSIETMVRAHNFDGLVFLCACDKIVPAMLMAAASLDLPSLFLTPGSMLPYEENGITYATPDLKESIGAYRAGKSMKRLSPVSARISVHPAVPAPCTARQIPWPSLRKLLVLPPLGRRQCPFASPRR